MKISRHLPAWLLKRLPARLARQCAQPSNVGSASALVEPSSTELTRQLLVDVSVIYQSDARTGIQRVVRSLMLQLLQAPPAGYRVCPIFATRQHGYRYAAPNFLEQAERIRFNQKTSFSTSNKPFTHGWPARAAINLVAKLSDSLRTVLASLGACFVAQAQDAAGRSVQAKVQVQSGDLFLGLDLAAHLLPRHQGQVLCWKKSGVNVHVLVYDLLPLQHPEWFNPKTTRNFKRWIRWVAVYADSAVCISENVKLELRTWLSASFGLPPSALPATTIVLGADIDASAPSSGFPPKAKFLLARLRNTPAVLMVGTLEPRKGYDQALAAFEQLWQQQASTPLLVIVGRTGWKTEALQEKLRMHPQAGKRLFWLEDVSDEYLAYLYAACTGVLVASRAEGFGLPLIEAALHNKSVLARDLPVFRETALPGVTFFSGESAASLTAAIPAWLQKTLREGAASYNQNVPTWQTAAAQLLSSLRLSAEPCRETDAGSAALTLTQGVAV